MLGGGPADHPDECTDQCMHPRVDREATRLTVSANRFCSDAPPLASSSSEWTPSRDPHAQVSVETSYQTEIAATHRAADASIPIQAEQGSVLSHTGPCVSEGVELEGVILTAKHLRLQERIEQVFGEFRPS